MRLFKTDGSFLSKFPSVTLGLLLASLTEVMGIQGIYLKLNGVSYSFSLTLVGYIYLVNNHSCV